MGNVPPGMGGEGGPPGENANPNSKGDGKDDPDKKKKKRFETNFANDGIIQRF